MRDLKRYEQDYQELPFEKIQARYRQKKVIEFLTRIKPAALLEVGCGLDPLFNGFADFQRMHVVEPGERFYAEAAARATQRSGVTVHRGTLQEVAPDLSGIHFDCIVMSSLLHEVDDSNSLLAAARALCSETTQLHINVPNANSFHRLLAVEMGLISSRYERSATQRLMQQHSTFDLIALEAMVLRAGFAVVERGSYFVKPFTHAQMAAMRASGLLTDALLDGLYAMAARLPEMASEIYVNVKRGG